VSVVVTYDGVMGKQRPRFGKGRVYTPAETVSFERALAWSARIAMRGRPMLTGPLVMRVEVTLSGRATCKPDADNLLKAVADSLQGVVYADDAAIVDVRVVKSSGEPPGLRIEVEAL
jgi:Holliday junction resolvase RusA-like endonuclease